MLQLCGMWSGNTGEIKMSSLKSKLVNRHKTITRAHTHTHKGLDTPFDIISGMRHIIYMQNPWSPESPC